MVEGVEDTTITFKVNNKKEKNKRGFVVNQKISNAEYISFVDEYSRNRIYEWKKKKGTKKYRFKNWMNFHGGNTRLLRAFLRGINVVVLLNLLITLLVTFVCIKYDVSYNLQSGLLLSPIVFPLTFLINNDFQRRERALNNIATFRSSLYNLFIHTRDIVTSLSANTRVPIIMTNKLEQLVIHLSEYLNTKDSEKNEAIAQIIYEDLSDISQIMTSIPDINSLTNKFLVINSRMIKHTEIVYAFEKLRIIRDYRTPFSDRAFTKTMTFFIPIIFAPLYVRLSKLDMRIQSWTPYATAVSVSLIFSILQSIQDRLYDPFISRSTDAINLKKLIEWNHSSIYHTANRKYSLEKFQISEDTPHFNFNHLSKHSIYTDEILKDDKNHLAAAATQNQFNDQTKISIAVDYFNVENLIKEGN